MTDTTEAAATPESQEAAAGGIQPMNARQAADQLAARRQEAASKAADTDTGDDVEEEGVTPEKSDKKSKENKTDDSQSGQSDDSADDDADDADDSEPKDKDEADKKAESEDDGEDDADDGDAQDDEDGEGDEPETIRLKANGEEHDVTMEELIRGWEKSVGAEKVVEETSARAKKLDEAEAKIKSDYGQAIHEVATLGQRLLQQLRSDDRYSQETMMQLRHEDPAEFAARREEMREKQESIQRARQLTQQRNQQIEQQKAKSQEDFAKKEAQKLKDHWKDLDDDGRDANLSKIGKYLTTQLGFDQKEVDGMVRAEMWIVAEKAMKYDQSRMNVKDLAKQVRKAPKMMKPGAKGAEKGELAKAEKALATAQADHKKVGSAKTGATLLEAQRKLKSMRSKRK